MNKLKRVFKAHSEYVSLRDAQHEALVKWQSFQGKRDVLRKAQAAAGLGDTLNGEYPWCDYAPVLETEHGGTVARLKEELFQAMAAVLLV